MSVLIDGMEMPSTCEECNLESFCGKWIEARKMCEEWKPEVKATIRHPDCPLLPVPPHGRLIDADALEKDVDKYIGGEESRSRFHHWVQVQRTVISESEEAHI